MSTSSPRFPLYIVSYGRYDNCYTAAALDEMDVDYSLIVESDEENVYRDRFGDDIVITVPDRYHEEYETCDDLGDTKSHGPGPARNFAWDHSIEQGFNWHWVMDDNINGFDRFHNNEKIRLGDGSFFRCMEDFVLQYRNVSMAGPRYRGFIFQKHQFPPLVFNTRIYSCNLIRNDVAYRWRGRYNEDTDLSLRMLKNKWCTVLFNVFLQDKIRTQRVSGGNTKNFYSAEGTYNKSKMLKRLHPDVTTLLKGGIKPSNSDRWHHNINYRPFKDNGLAKKEDPGIEIGDYDYQLITDVQS